MGFAHDLIQVRDSKESRMTPGLLAGAAGITETPVTEMGKAGRGAVLNLLYYYLCVRGRMQKSGVQFWT